jgi:peroxiredoxin Q/BCP
MSRLQQLIPRRTPQRDTLVGDKRKTVTISAAKLAPTFTAETCTGERFDMADWHNCKVWLTFLRYAGCSISQLRLQEMARCYPNWASPEVRVACVMHSPAKRIREHTDRLKVPFTIIADPEREVYDLYGLRRAGIFGLLHPRGMERSVRAMFQGHLLGPVDGPLDTVPADFLIDEDGMIAQAYYGSHIGDHIPFRQVESWLGFKLQ